MKIRHFPAAIIVIATLALSGYFAPSIVAQDSTTFSPVPPPSNPPVMAQPVQLAAGVEDVLKLSRAKVNEDVIIAFVQNGNRAFSLSASEILYLRKEGVSDRVLTAMLGQTPPPATTPTSSFAAEASAPQYVSQPATTYLENPVSTVYVGTPTYYSFYDPWPYWSSWYAYPAFSFGFYWGWGWGGCGYWSYPSYCYPSYNYCYNGSWNNYCNGYYSSSATTRPSANTALVSEMRQPSGVSGGRPLVSEMRQPSGVNQSTPLTSEMRQPSGVNQASARNGLSRTENRLAGSTSGAKTTSYWSGNGNRPTAPTGSQPGAASLSGSRAAAPRTASTTTARTPAVRQVENRSGNQLVGSNGRSTAAGGWAGQRPTAPSYVNQSAGSVSRSSSGVNRSPSTTWSRAASPSVNRSMSSPSASFQRSSSPSYRSSGSFGGASRPSMSPSFSSRGSAGAMRGGSGFSGGGTRSSMASGGGGFRGGGMGGGGRTR